METTILFVKQLFFFFNEISVFLLLGFFIAGVLHLFFPESLIRKHLGKGTFGSVLKSTLFGIPLPICSCGVIPIAASLKKNGASDGATISFLISTPQVGADSFMITYSLMGGLFSVFRIVASLVTALLAGVAVNFFAHDKKGKKGKKGKKDKTEKEPSIPAHSNTEETETFLDRAKNSLHYVEYNLLGSIANSLLIGIVVAGVISVMTPADFFENYFSNNFLSMLLMLITGIPMYICATASTPVAAALLMKGLSPGAALVFLLTGPATNAIGIATIYRLMGKRVTVICLGVISLVSITLGFILNLIANKPGLITLMKHGDHQMLPAWINTCGTVILAAMLIWYYLSTLSLPWSFKTEEIPEKNLSGADANHRESLEVMGMTCQHCASTVKSALESLEGISEVVVDLKNAKVSFHRNQSTDQEKLKAAIIAAGFEIPTKNPS